MLNLLLHACAAGAATLVLPQEPMTELFGATLHFGDFDRDGAEDIYVSDPVAGDRLLHNRGGGLYEDVTAAHGLDADARSLFALWLDFDADCAFDLCVGGLDGSVRLLQNADRGHFVDVTPNTGLQARGSTSPTRVSAHTSGPSSPRGRPTARDQARSRSGTTLRQARASSSAQAATSVLAA
jgi:hypothetical protein